MKLPHRSPAPVLALCLTSIVACAPPPARANASPQVSPSPRRSPSRPSSDPRLKRPVALDSIRQGDFYETFQALARQHKIAFVIEGAPLQKALASDKLEGLSDTPSLAAAVERLASAFDFDAEFKGGAYILKKRYTDPRDLPSVTLEECSLAVADMIRAFKAFRPDHATSTGSPFAGPTMQRLFDSLSPEQVAAMQRGALAISDLGGSQKSILQQYALHLYVEPAFSDFDSSASDFNNLDKTYLAVQEAPGTNGRKLFGYGFPSRDGRPVFISFEHNRPPRPFLPPASPSTPSKPNDTKIAGRPNPHLSTVAELLTRLKKRGDIPLSTDEAMKAKILVVIGEEHASPLQLVTAAADIFGARVINNKEKGGALTRRRVPLPRDVSGLSAFVLDSVPDPLLRAMHYSAAPPTRPGSGNTDAMGKSDRPLVAPDQRLMRAYFSQNLEWKQRLRVLPLALRSEAGKQLLSSVEPSLKNKNGKLPVPELSDEERNLLAVALMGRLLSSTSQHLTTSPPRYITNFDTLNLQGGVEGRKLSVYFSVPYPDLEFKPGLGVVGGGETLLKEN